MVIFASMDLKHLRTHSFVQNATFEVELRAVMLPNASAPAKKIMAASSVIF